MSLLEDLHETQMENEPMELKTEIERKVAEYVSLTREAAEIKKKIETLKGWFEKRGTEDLNATKVKTVGYWGDNGKVEVGRSETVSAVALNLLEDVFGAASYKELVKPKESLEMTAACKQLLAPIALGNYIKTPMDEIICSATADEKARAALRKKLRGNFKADKKAFISIAGLSEKDAEYYAYMAAESAAYDHFRRLLEAGWNGPIDEAAISEAINTIRTAVLVEECVKVTVESAE